MYLKKKIRNILLDFDDNVELPSRFYKYTDRIKKSHRLIIKSKKGYHCDNCNYDFKTKQNYKVDTYHKCPKCKQKLMVKSSRLRRYKQTDQFAILEREQGYYIIRAFEVATWYDCGKYDSHICEYGRQLYDEYLNMISEAYNNNISATTSGKYINHSCFMDNHWKENGSYYHTLGEVYKLYPYNIKRVLKGTKYQYCQLDKFAQNINYFDVIEFLRNSNHATEILIKNKLYLLAYNLMSYSRRKFLVNFDYKFIKQNLLYIRSHKLDIDEIEVFKYLKKENIKLIRKYGKYELNTEILEKYKIDLETADTRIPNLVKSLHEYYDYLSFAKDLGYDMKDKRILYPKNLILEHDKLNEMIEINKNKIINKKISERYKELSKNTWKDKEFIIFPAKNINAMINESSQMNNCVKTYAMRYSNGECDIYFMRLLTNTKKSLVTVEVRDNKVVQKRIKNNKLTDEIQNSFLEKWEKEVLSVC